VRLRTRLSGAPRRLLGLLVLLPGGLIPLGAFAPPVNAQAVSYLTGIGDEQPAMFLSPLYQQLHTSISRYIAPYDVAEQPADLSAFRLWYRYAEAQHVQPLIAFYHSRVTPERMPSVSAYRREIKKFIKLFPAIESYQPWNEANRGNVQGQFKSPSASQSAGYYLALKSACSRCQIVGLDVLDGQSIKPTVNYIRQFQRDVRLAHGSLPTIWGLHNYSDTNRFRTAGTKAVLAVVSGQVWLTETGGVVEFPPSFSNLRGAGLTRAAKALSFMFKLAAISARIKRLYIFQWTGSAAGARFDAGLMSPDGTTPRAGYYVVCRQLLGVHSSKCTSSTAPAPVAVASSPAAASPASSSPLGVGPTISGSIALTGGVATTGAAEALTDTSVSSSVALTGGSSAGE
jgi:hypothetical protein